MKTDRMEVMPSLPNLEEERHELYEFVERLMKQILKQSNYSIQVFYSYDAQQLFRTLCVTPTKEYLIIVEADDISSYCQKISRFIGYDVIVVSPKVVCWEWGEAISVIKADKIKENYSEAVGKINISFRKSNTIIPNWLDKKIFNDYNAIYAPEHKRYEYNLDLNDEELKVYLGTYFPRSYAEMFCIVDNLLQNDVFARGFDCRQINILDCGCGTGGEILGLITAIDKYFSKLKINITAIDGNEKALAILKNIIVEFPSQNIQVKIKTLCQTFNSETDLMKFANGSKSYHFVLCNKMVCELMSKHILLKDAYAIMSEILFSHLQENGVLILLDVTTKDEISGLFYPQLMNRQINELARRNKAIETLLPLACACNVGCKEMCFMQQIFNVSHSHKISDESKVCYRVLCSDSLKNAIMHNVKNVRGLAYVIHPIKYKKNDVSAFCKQSKEEIQTVVDAFNINI